MTTTLEPTAQTGMRLELDDVRLSYTGAPVVEGLSLTVQPGEILVLTGPSGCGKSTVLRALAGLLAPDSGRVLADGAEVSTTSRDRGMVFQDSALLPWRTVRSNIELALQLRGAPRAGRRERADRWIDELGLTGFGDYLPKSLSGGMRQRVQLARGLAGAPRAVMMDEPFAALDTQTRAAMQRLLIDTWRAHPTTVVFVTHDVDEAVKLGDQVAVFGGGGRLVQVDAPQDLLGRPRNAFVESLIGRDRGYRRLSFVPARDLPLHDVVTVGTDATAREVHDTSARSGKSWVLSVDADGRPVSWLDGRGDGDELGQVPVGNTFTEDDSCRAALDGALASPAGLAVHVDAAGRVVGGVGHDEIARYVTSLRSAEGGTTEDAAVEAQT